MRSKLKVIPAILLLTLTISTQQTNALLADDIASAAAANTTQAKFDFLKNAWTNLRSVQPLDGRLAAILQREINDQLILNPENLPLDILQHRNIFMLNQEVRNKMIWSYGHKIAQVMNIDNKNHLYAEYFHNIVRAFEHEPRIAFKMFTHAIEEMFRIKPLKELTQYLDAISFDNSKSWDLKIDIQICLYYKYLKSGLIDIDYLLLISYYFREYKLRCPYTLLYSRVKSLDKAIARLPLPLRMLFFPEMPVCTKNKAHNELLLGKINDTNAAKPDIFTSPNQNFMTDGGNWVFVFQTEQDARGFSILKAAMRNLQSNHFLYRDVADGNKIVAWTSRGVPETGWFNLSFKNNNLVFSQSGFLMCAATTTGANWRTVYGFQSSLHTESTECQWELVGKCPAA